MHIEIPAKYICALKVFAPTKDIRHYLNAVYLHVGSSGARLVALDGNIGGIFKLQGVHSPTGVRALIPRSTFDHVKPDALSVSVTLSAEGVTVGHANSTRSASLMPDRYVDYTRIRSTGDLSRIARFDPALVTLVGKAAVILHGKNQESKGVIHQRGSDTAIFTLGVDDFCGFIAPMQSIENIPTPSWVFDDIEAAP